MAEILSIQQKTPINQSINQSIVVKTGYYVEKHILYFIPGPPLNVVNMLAEEVQECLYF